MHYVCWVSSWSPARRRQAKPRCTHRKRVERQWLTASCDTGRAASSQAAVRASRRGGEREHHLARRPGDDEAPGKCQGDGLEKIQARGRSLEHASAPAPTRVDDRPTCYILGSEQTICLVDAHTSRRFSGAHSGWCAVHALDQTSMASTHGRARPLPNRVTCISERSVMQLYEPLTRN